ncbi:MAG: S8 family peptidase [Salinivirgaceae bacterium]|nr:S8 family peptidase [Salinivirgaceae bacterium]
MNRKIAIISVLITGITLCSFSQSNISARLESILQQKKSKETHIVVKLKNQWNIDSIITIHNQNKYTTNERAIRTIKSIRKFTSTNQKSFSQHIHDIINQGYNLKITHQFWSANLIALVGNEAAIRLLAIHPDIDRVSFDHTDYRAYSTELGSGNRTKGKATSGIQAIGVRKMWELGYTGLGRKVLSVDTGVYTSHPSIAGRFLGLYSTMAESYFGFNNPLPVDISSSTHGTHTIGTVLGTIDNNGDSIGIAYKAYYMVSDPIVSNLSEVRRLSEILSCFEWALDPDQNPETVNDIPDVITNSWGLENSGIIEDCDAPETLVFNVLEAAGVAMVFSAGNSGPNVGTIGQPAHIARSTTNIFSVGAVNAQSSSLNIADFSSRGPTNCPAENGSPLHIKPEVVAPGVNVYSAQGLDGYGSLSGTSMSAPHVAGIVLLLKEAFPEVSGTEILQAIYETAIDLGDSGEDNTFGNGMINVWNAFQHLSQTHTPTPPMTGGDIKTSAEGTFSNNHNEILATIQCSNIGTAVSIINQIKFHINETEIIKDTIITVEPNEVQEFTTILDISELEEAVKYEVKLYANPQTYSDIDTVNNYSWFQLTKPHSVELPFTETFETASFDLSNTKVMVSNPDKSFTWRADTVPQFGNSTKSASMKFRFYTQKNEKDYMQLFPINLNHPEELNLGFKYAYAEKTVFIKDTLLVTISTDGINFTDTLWVKAGTELATVKGWHYSNLFIPTKPKEWAYANIDLRAYRGASTIWIRFEAINDNGNDLFIDDIAVYENTDPLSIQEPTTRQAPKPVVYPNPAKSEVHILFSPPTNKRQITLFDITGRQIRIEKTVVNENEITIQLPKLETGLYIISVFEEQNISTHTIVIE